MGREIEGYASQASVNRGESIELFVNGTDPNYSIEIYRIGWYGGKCGLLMMHPTRCATRCRRKAIGKSPGNNNPGQNCRITRRARQSQLNL